MALAFCDRVTNLVLRRTYGNCFGDVSLMEVEEYLNSTYRSDVDFVDGVLEKWNWASTIC